MTARSKMYQTIKAAMTRRPSAASTLNVRHAAAVSMTSKPTPVRMMPVNRVAGGKTCVAPVPNRITSGSSSSAAEKSAMQSSAMGGGVQSRMMSCSVRMTGPFRISLLTCSSPLAKERTKTPFVLSRFSCTPQFPYLTVDRHRTRHHTSVPMISRFTSA
jgi:hypothetical protein